MLPEAVHAFNHMMPKFEYEKSEIKLVAFETFSHHQGDVMRLDVVKFFQPVIIQEIRVIPLGTVIKANMIGGLRLGATVPLKFDLEFYVNNIKNTSLSTFQKVAMLNYEHNINIMILTKEEIATDMLVIKGCYTSITIAIYGNIVYSRDLLGTIEPNLDNQFNGIDGSLGDDNGNGQVDDKFCKPILTMPPLHDHSHTNGYGGSSDARTEIIPTESSLKTAQSSLLTSNDAQTCKEQTDVRNAKSPCYNWKKALLLSPTRGRSSSPQVSVETNRPHSSEPSVTPQSPIPATPLQANDFASHIIRQEIITGGLVENLEDPFRFVPFPFEKEAVVPSAENSKASHSAKERMVPANGEDRDSNTRIRGLIADLSHKKESILTNAHGLVDLLTPWCYGMKELSDILSRELVSCLHWSHSKFAKGDVDGWKSEVLALVEALRDLISFGLNLENVRGRALETQVLENALHCVRDVFSSLLGVNESLCDLLKSGRDTFLMGIRGLWMYWLETSYTAIFSCILNSSHSEMGVPKLIVAAAGSTPFLNYVLYGPTSMLLRQEVSETKSDLNPTIYQILADKFGDILTIVDTKTTLNLGTLTPLFYNLEFCHLTTSLQTVVNKLCTDEHSTSQNFSSTIDGNVEQQFNTLTDQVHCMSWMYARLSNLALIPLNTMSELGILDIFMLLLTFAQTHIFQHNSRIDGPNHEIIVLVDTVLEAVRVMYLQSNDTIGLLVRTPETLRDLMETIVALDTCLGSAEQLEKYKTRALEIYFTIYAYHCTRLLLNPKNSPPNPSPAYKTLLAFMNPDTSTFPHSVTNDGELSLSQKATLLVLSLGDNCDCCLRPLFGNDKPGQAQHLFWSTLSYATFNDHQQAFIQSYIERLAIGVAELEPNAALNSDTSRLIAYIKRIHLPPKASSTPLVPLVPSAPAIHECLKEEIELLKLTSCNKIFAPAPAFCQQCVITMVLVLALDKVCADKTESPGIEKTWDISVDFFKWATKQLNRQATTLQSPTKPLSSPPKTGRPFWLILKLVEAWLNLLKKQFQLPSPYNAFSPNLHLNDTSKDQASPRTSVMALLELYVCLAKFSNDALQHENSEHLQNLNGAIQNQIFDCLATWASQSHPRDGHSMRHTPLALILGSLVTMAQQEVNLKHNICTELNAENSLTCILKFFSLFLPLTLPMSNNQNFKPKDMSKIKERILSMRKTWSSALSTITKPLIDLFVTLFWGSNGDKRLVVDLFAQLCDVSATLSGDLVQGLIATHSALVERPDWEEAFDDPLQAGAIIDWLLAFKRVFTLLNKLIEYPSLKAAFLYPQDTKSSSHYASHAPKHAPLGQVLVSPYLRQVLEILYNPRIREPVIYRSTELAESCRRTKHPLLDSLDREAHHFLATLLDPSVALNPPQLSNPTFSRSGLRQIANALPGPQDLQLIAKTYTLMPSQVKKRLTANNLDESYTKLKHSLVAMGSLTTNDITFANLKYTIENDQPRVFLDVLDVSYSVISKTTPLQAIETIGVCLEFLKNILICDMCLPASPSHRTLRYGVPRFKAQIYWGKPGLKHPLVSMKIFLMELTTSTDFKVKNLATQLLEDINSFITFLNKDVATTPLKKDSSDKDYLEIVKEYKPDTLEHQFERRAMFINIDNRLINES